MASSGLITSKDGCWCGAGDGCKGESSHPSMLQVISFLVSLNVKILAYLQIIEGFSIKEKVICIHMHMIMQVKVYHNNTAYKQT